MKTALIVVVSLLALLLLVAGALLLYVRNGDGPRGPIPGGELVRGELVDSQNVDWQQVLQEQAVGEIELQLLNPVGSRVTGAFVHAGELYVPCDLGYVWRRVPSTSLRTVLRVIWWFKDWHLHAAEDGRVIVRAAGKRYARTAVRVTDEALLDTFRNQVSTAAAEYFGGLNPIQTDPEDIWFFRLDPR